MGIDGIKNIGVLITINGVDILKKIKSEDSLDVHSIPPKRRWMSRRWHVKPIPGEEAIRRRQASSLVQRI